MAVYSYDKYGNFLYGAKDNTSPYYHANIVATAVDYNTVHITWNQIVPDPVDSNPTYWALVKTLTGAPDSPYEGKIVTGGPITPPTTTVGNVVDTTTSISFSTEWYETFTTNTNVEVNYSLWVFNPSITGTSNVTGWIYCGDSSTIIVNATTTLDTISNWIPRAWQNSINGVGESLGEYEYEDLMATLRAYSLAYDSLRIKTNLLELSNVPRYLTTSLAKARQLDFGFEYEVALGDPYYKSLTYSGDKINSLKGTIKGLSEYIVALTHLENKIEIGHNIFLDYNDSSFEESLGQWHVNKLTAAGTTGTTATQVLYSSTTGTTYPHLAPDYAVSDSNADGGPTVRKLGAMKVVIATGGAGAILCPTSTTFSLDVLNTTTLDITTLIPVTTGESYVFSGWMVGNPTTYSTVTPYISWYDYNGKHISDTQAAVTFINSQAAAHVPNIVAVTKTVTASWQEFNAGSDMAASAGLTMGFKVPVGASFALPMIKITGAGTTYFDMFQFARHQDSIEYQDARQLNVYLRGQEENILRNASFETTTILGGTSGITTGWFANNATLDSVASLYTASTGVTSITGNDQLLALAITATANADLTTHLAPEQLYTGPIIYSDWMEVDPNISYTFTIYPNQYQVGSTYYDYKGRIGIEFSSMPSEDKQNSIVTYPDSNAYFYGSTNYLLTSEITSATYDDASSRIILTFKTGTPVGFSLSNPISIKGMLNYPELNVTNAESSIAAYQLRIDLQGNYYITLPQNLVSTPDGAVDTSSAIMCLMYGDSVSLTYEDLVSYANITEVSVDLSGNSTDGPNTRPSYVAAVAPPYSKDTGMPYARVYLMPNILTGNTVIVDGLRFSPTLLVDQYYQQNSTANLLGNIGAGTPTPIGTSNPLNTGTSGDLISSNKIKASDYFSGYGNSTAALNNGSIDPLTTQYYDPKFCAWERKLWFNFIGNPNFAMNTMGWMSMGDAALTYDAVNMRANVDILAPGMGGVSTMFALPHPALGGEDIVVTVTITGMSDSETYTITSPDLSTPLYGNTPYTFNNNLAVTSYLSASTQTLSAVFQATAGSMMGTIELNVVSNLGTDTHIQIISASAEYGSTSSASFTTGYSGTFTLANPMDPTMSLYASFNDSYDTGISSYTPDWPIKINRLIATIHDYIPNGSTFRITKGWPSKPISDLTESLIYSPSFERNLGLWTGEQATLTRITYPGRYLDLVTHGIAYARVTANTLEEYEGYFGLISEPIDVDYTKSYYGSVAVRPVAGTNAQGFYSLKVDAYKRVSGGTDILLNTFNNKIEFSTLPITPPGTKFTTSSVDPSTILDPITGLHTVVAGDRWIDPNSLTQTSELTWIVNELDGVGQWVENDESIYYNPGNESAFTGYCSFQTSPPTNPVVGNRWFDTGSGNAYGEYIGYVWYDDLETVTDYNATTHAAETPAYTRQWVELSVMYTQNDVYLDELHSPTWAYLNVLLSKKDLQEISYTVPGQSAPDTSPTANANVDYVRIRVECSPDQYYPGQSFDVDRVVFRE